MLFLRRQRSRRSWALLGLLAGLLGILPAHASPAVAEAGEASRLAPDPNRLGYAFAEPQILARQIIFGLAHGVTLLARACVEAPEALRNPVREAYGAWSQRYRARILDSEQVLARHYFGTRATAAREQDIAAALNLPLQLDLRTSEQLHEACASFPAALAQERYDLDLLFAAQRDAQRLGRAFEIRETVKQCRLRVPADKAAGLDAAFARWQEDNRALETEAQVSWLGRRGDRNDLARWQDEIGQTVRRALTPAPAAEARCQDLAAALVTPPYQLASLFADLAPAVAASPGAPVWAPVAVELSPTTDGRETPAGAAPATGRPAPDAASPPTYVVLLGAYASTYSAYLRQLQARLTEMGIPNFTEPFEAPGPRRTRLRAGPFESHEAAAQALARMRPIPLDGLITVRPPEPAN